MFIGRHFYRKKADKELLIDRMCTVGLRRPNWTWCEFVRTGISKYWPRTKSCEKLFTHETLNYRTCAQAHTNIHVAAQTRSTTVETGYIEYWPGWLWTRPGSLDTLRPHSYVTNASEKTMFNCKRRRPSTNIWRRFQQSSDLNLDAIVCVVIRQPPGGGFENTSTVRLLM